MTSTTRPDVPVLRTTAPARGARIAGIGSSQPEQRVTADELGHPFGKDGDWVRARTGIEVLHRLSPGEDLLVHVEAAASGALCDADAQASEIDLLVVATCSDPHAMGPSLAERLVAALGLNCGYMELNAACAGFSYALSTADDLIRAGSATKVLIVGAESMSALLDEDDLPTSIIFGDGAGAAVVTAHHESQIGPGVRGSDGELAEMVAVDNDGFLRMRGQEVFRWAVETVPRVALEACRVAGVRIEEIEFLVLHQANLRIIEAVRQRLHLKPTACVSHDIRRSGNTSAASIPIALSQLRKAGQLKSGATALLVGFGAGLSYSGQVIVTP